MTKPKPPALPAALEAIAAAPLPALAVLDRADLKAAQRRIAEALRPTIPRTK